jgi:hypothetical protein
MIYKEVHRLLLPAWLWMHTPGRMFCRCTNQPDDTSSLLVENPEYLAAAFFEDARSAEAKFHKPGDFSTSERSRFLCTNG